MELWVRSQDRALLRKPEQLGVVEGNEYWYISENLLINYGHYATKERAFEVLDEIQNILKPKYILNASSIKPNGDYYEKNGEIYQDYSADARIEQLNIYVYEMPEK